MMKLKWGRIILCGLIAGIAWNLLSAAALALVGRDFLDAVGRAATHAPQRALFFYGIDLAMGVWAVWLYAVIRRGGDSGVTSAIAAGVAWWLLKSLQSAKWAAMGFIPLTVAPALLAATLPAILIATAAGAWLHDRH